MCKNFFSSVLKPQFIISYHPHSLYSQKTFDAAPNHYYNL